MKGTKSQIIGGGNLKGGTVKGATQYKPPAKEITPEVLEKIKEEYTSFVKRDFYNQAMLDNYIFMHDNQLIVEFFNCSPFPEKETSLINTDGEPLKRPERKIIFAIAKVLACSPDINRKLVDGEMVDLPEGDPRRINIGDIVTVRDFDVATMINPKYEVIHSATALNKSNANMSSKAPDKYMNNIGNKVRNLFIPNKLDLRTQYFDNYIFELGKPEIRFKPKDPMMLVNSMLAYELEENED
jgi:hypothetical protein